MLEISHFGSVLFTRSVSVDTLLTQRPEDTTGGALFFHNNPIRKPWQRQRTAQVGNHVFYR